LGFTGECSEGAVEDALHLNRRPLTAARRRRSPHHWSTLFTGPDIGSSRHPETLHLEESQHFPFRVDDAEPRYEQVRDEAKQVIAAKKQPISKLTYPSPQPIPGEKD
jgi:hypothetical protein